MTRPAPADLQRWSEEVARDPGSLAFLPLARAYRRQGERDAALRLCRRGLESHPMHVEGHGLLALLYLEAGDRHRAADAWALVLRLEPGNFDALRGLGFCHLEAGDLDRARQHLEAAALIRAADPTVREALQLVRQRQEARRVRAGAEEQAPPPPAESVAAASPDAFPWEEGGDAAAAPPPPELGLPGGRGTPPATREAPPPAPPPTPLPEDPVRLFDGVIRGPVLGVLLVDPEGMVLAGRVRDRSLAPEVVGAHLGDAMEEVARAAEHLRLGAWEGILLRTDAALLHLSPAADDCVVVIGAGRDVPVGWLVRGAAQAQQLARQFVWSRP